MSFWKKKKVVPNIEQQYQEALKALEPYRRDAYLPHCFTTEPAFSPHHKMGGLPYLRHEDDWPVCPGCGKHMQLFLQLDMSLIPEKKSDGLVQLFYCTSVEPKHCEVDHDGWEPFSQNAIRRLIHVDGPSAQIKYDIDELFPENRISGWERVDDYPDWEERSELGIGSDTYEISDLMEEREEGNTKGGDKLFGWPLWVQGTEYPSDRTTGSTMELLFQIHSEDNLPFMFGDLGTGHLTQSPDNQEELGFGWACG